MKFSYQWLKELAPRIPKPEALADLLTFHSFEIESLTKSKGDSIFDIKILPDRISDAGSYWGLSQEIAAISGFRFVSPARTLLSSNILGKKIPSSEFSVIVEDAATCTRYIGCVLKGVLVTTSSKNTQARLRGLGMNSINSLVDFANIAMLETGQPLHVFDRDKIVGKRIIVRKARRGEKMLALDSVEYELDETMTVIADEAGPLAIAGIKGGKRAEVDTNTTNIVVEAALFDGVMIRKTARALKLSTDASQRFVQGTDPNASQLGALRLVELILKNTKGKVMGYTDYNPRPQTPRTVALRKEKIESVLGMSIDEKEMTSVLERLGFAVHHMKGPRQILLKNAKKLIGKPYHFGASAMYDAPDRFDCSSLMVYLFRSVGVPVPRMSFEQYAYGAPVAEDALLPGDLVFRARGVKESSWQHDVGHVGLYIGGGKVIDASGKKGKVAMRTLKEFRAEARRYFGARRILHASHEAHYLVTIPTARRDITTEENLVEEVGRVVGYDRIPETPFHEAFSYQTPQDDVLWKERIKNFLVSAGFYEADTYDFLGAQDIERFGGSIENHWELENPIRPELMYLRRSVTPLLARIVAENHQHQDALKIFAMGDVFLPERFVKDPSEAEEGRIVGALWMKEAGDETILLGKGTIVSLCESVGITDVVIEDISEKDFPFLHPHRSGIVMVGGRRAGYIGSLHPLVTQSLGIKKGEIVVFELLLSHIVGSAEGEFEYQEPSKYPSIVRDLSILVPEDIRVAEVEDIVENVGGELLWQTELFDLYEGENIREGVRSMAFHLIFQSGARTLRDSEVEEAVKKIIAALESKEWEVRQ